MKRILGTLSLLLGTYLITNSPASITGSFAGTYLTATLNPLVGFFFLFISGVLFLHGLERKVKGNIASDLLKQRRIPLRPNELRKIAKRMDFEVRSGSKHTLVRGDTPEGGKYIVTTIPNGKIKKPTSRGILKKLSANYQ